MPTVMRPRGPRRTPLEVLAQAIELRTGLAVGIREFAVHRAAPPPESPPPAG